jgi:hypothetical protein
MSRARYLLLGLGLLCALLAPAQAQWDPDPPVLTQLRNKAAAARLAQGFPAVDPATQRAPRLTDNTALAYVVGDIWLDPWGIQWTALNVSGQAYDYGLWITTTIQPTARPLDGLTTQPAVAYGTKLLRTGYTGNALQLRVASAATAQIGFLASGEIDAAEADRFCATEPSTACEIVTIYDQGANGYNATCAPGNAPVWDRGRRINDRRVISFQSIKQVTSGGPAAVDQYCTISASMAWNTELSSWLMVSRQNNSASRTDEHGLLSNITGASGWSQTGGDGKGIRGTGLQGQTSMHIPTTPSAFMVVTGASFIRVYNLGNYDSSSHPNPGVASSGALLGYDATNLGSMMDLAAFALWTSERSTTSAQPAELAPFESAFGIQRQHDNKVVVIGASDSSGTVNLRGSSWPAEVDHLLTPGALVWNNSSHGNSTAVAITYVANFLSNLYTYQRGAGARNFVVVYTIVGNDIRSDVTFATIKANIQSYATTAKALGSNVRIVFATKTFACDYWSNPAQVAVLVAYNDWIKANYNVPVASGGAGGDGLADQIESPLVSRDDYYTTPPAPLMCNAGVSPDGIHLTTENQSSMAPIFATAINGVLR